MELHYMGPDFRKPDLAEKMAERRRRSLAATRRYSFRALMARMLFALAERHEAWRIARESSEAGTARKRPSRQTNTEENEMYGLGEYKVSRQLREEIRQEVAVARLGKPARASRETRPYLVRDLSWELARFLDKETVTASAPAASSSASG